MSLSLEQQARLRLVLDALQQSIQAEMRAHRPRDAQVDASAGDDVVADVLSNDAVAQYSHEHQEWQALQRARARLEENISDLCSECGAAIPFARLEVEPTAERCITCQSALEADEQRLRLHRHAHAGR